MTVPAAAAQIGVPVEAAMSMPSCMRPQRQPYPLTTGPFTGQMKPAADGAPVPVEPALVCALRIAAASSALFADERLDLLEVLLARLARVRERALLEPSRSGEGVATRRKLVADDARLVSAR